MKGERERETKVETVKTSTACVLESILGNNSGIKDTRSERKRRRYG